MVIALYFFYQESLSFDVVLFLRNSHSDFGSRNPLVQFWNISLTKILRLSNFLFSASLEVTGSFGPLDKNNIKKLYQKSIDLERQGIERHFDNKQAAAEC